jgi:hypothetical protein
MAANCWNMKRKHTKKYCCERFVQCAEEGSIFHCGKEDETEWAVKDFYHLYYCPFCGNFIKGQGWGEYNQKAPSKQRER